MQESAGERKEIKGEKAGDGRNLGEGGLCRKLVFGSKEQRNKEDRRSSVFRIGNNKEGDDKCGDPGGRELSGKPNEKTACSSTLLPKNWIFSTPSTKLKEKKPAPETESNQKLSKFQFRTPLTNRNSKLQNSETIYKKFPILSNCENIEDESFQRIEQKKAVELLLSLKEKENKKKALKMMSVFEEVQELINKSHTLRMDQIEFLNQVFENPLPDIEELPTTVFNFVNRVK